MGGRNESEGVSGVADQEYIGGSPLYEDVLTLMIESGSDYYQFMNGRYPEIRPFTTVDKTDLVLDRICDSLLSRDSLEAVASCMYKRMRVKGSPTWRNVHPESRDVYITMAYECMSAALVAVGLMGKSDG